MNRNQHILIILLVRVLTERTSNRNLSPLPLEIKEKKDINWDKIFKLSMRHEIAGVLFDGISTLPEKQRPQDEILMQWAAYVYSAERNYQMYSKRCSEVWHLLSSNISSLALMKGLLLSRHYPRPARRNIGDMDLLLTSSALPVAIDSLQEHGAVIDTQSDPKHTTAVYKSLNVELHFKSIYFYNTKTEKRFQLLETEQTASEALSNEIIEGDLSVKAFPPLFEMIYLTAHIQHHLLLEEINLRHITDWMLALKYNRTTLGIMESQLINHLDQLGLTRLWRALGYISVKYLALEVDSYAGCTHFDPKEAQRGEFLFRITLSQRIPGCRPYEPRREGESIIKKARLYGELLKRCFRLRTLIPREAIAAPVGFLVNAYRRRWN
ncbi:MAG: nucleotidyltransferase family protein [Bacteroidales bacterium]|nr:nucleotidyltransferase family protein [Bacteroidales bacterium]